MGTTSTTEAPTTTTTTEAPTTTTTTEAPTTPSPPKPSPTPNPPNPATGTWSVTDADTNVTCIIVKMSSSFVVSYTTEDKLEKNATLRMPSNATSTGTCKENQSITLSWISEEEKTNEFTLEFSSHNKEQQNETTAQFGLAKISVKLYTDAAHFPNASLPSVLNASLYYTNVNNSYRCSTEAVVPLAGETKAYLHLSKVQMEAYRTQTDDKFNSAVDCAADGVVTSDIVPIAVGCALAALVVVVLIAYLIGRRRARQRGYQSV